MEQPKAATTEGAQEPLTEAMLLERATPLMKGEEARKAASELANREELSESSLKKLLIHWGGDPELGLRFLSHPSATVSLVRDLAHYGASNAYLLNLSRVPKWRVHFMIRSRLHVEDNPEILLNLCRDAVPLEFRTLFRRLMPHKDTFLALLRDETIESKNALRPTDLLPLLESKDAELRLAAVMASRHLESGHATSVEPPPTLEDADRVEFALKRRLQRYH